MEQELLKLAMRETWTDSDDFNPYEQSGGNYDDAYYAGRDDGETSLAKRLLTKYFPERGIM
jgi:hypothetical protein